MLDPITKTIDVPCKQKLAFEVFLHEMDTWWPLGKFTVSAMRGNVAKGISVEPKVGGKIVEIGHDDQRHEWGTIKTYDPYDAFSMDFHISHPDYPFYGFTLVEVRFTPVSDASTRVELKQSNWEALRELAEGVRRGYEFGWNSIFAEAYKSACEKRAA